jgi:DNA-binding NarL/FixJ family response regulator
MAVSGLVAAGLTNPEVGTRLYVSRRTVETHLAHIFRKLNFVSRTQLASEFTRRNSTESRTQPAPAHSS